jgi:hypothetical protein
MSTNRCYIELTRPTTSAVDHSSTTNEVRNILGSFYGPDFLFEDDTWVQEMFIKHEVVETLNPSSGWNDNVQTLIVQYESTRDLTEFINEYFNHEFFVKYKSALEGQGWTVSQPVMSIE